MAHKELYLAHGQWCQQCPLISGSDLGNDGNIQPEASQGHACIVSSSSWHLPCHAVDFDEVSSYVTDYAHVVHDISSGSCSDSPRASSGLVHRCKTIPHRRCFNQI